MADFKAVQPRAVSDLLLDPENPRLPEHIDTDDQLALVRFFDEHYNLEELAVSMAQKGYFSEEPMLTVPAGNRAVVVEGNRRLATLKLLLQEEARAASSRPEFWNTLATEAESRDDLDPVPTFEYENRDDLLEYLGFRHVTGVTPWTAEAKARYVTSLVRGGRTFAQTAKAIGSRQDAIRRQFVAYSALEQAAAAGEPVDRARRFFGVFYRALQAPGVRSFMHLVEPPDIEEDNPKPVESGFEARVAEVSSLLFGDETTGAVITDSRQITNLGRILEHEDAATVLLEERDFSLALDIVGGDRRSIETSLARARAALIQARGHAFEFVGDAEVIEKAQAVQAVLEDVLETLGPAQADVDQAPDN